MALVLFVHIKLKPGVLDDYLPGVLENAATAPNVEPGCQAFEVFVPDDDRDTVYLYEVYDDQAALTAHEATEHYKKARAVGAKYIETVTRTACTPFT